MYFTQEGAGQLVRNLKQAPFFADKEIVLLNFGSLAYKQPQQLMILIYYLAIGQELDMVINIDGFNEVTFSSINNERNIDISMPSVYGMQPIIDLIDQTTLTEEKIASLAKINLHKTRANRLAQTMQETTFASVYFVLKQFHTISSNRYQNETIIFSQLESTNLEDSMIYIYPAETKLGDSILFENIATMWMTSSIMIRHLLQGQNIPYYHFLQPNQYFSKKEFSSEEATIALHEQSPFHHGPEKGYPILMQKFDLLKQNGVNFHSALAIFDDEPNIVYIDNCCHFNQFGNQILADFVAEAILETQSF